MRTNSRNCSRRFLSRQRARRLLFCPAEGRILYLNATLADWLDYDLAEIADRDLEIRDTSSPRRRGLLSHVQGQPGAVRTETIDLDLKRKGGQRLPVRLLHRVAFAADGTAGVSRTLVLNRSAEAGGAEGLRDAEVRFARLFNTSPFAIATLSRSGGIETTNARFAGFLPSQQVGGPRDLLSLIAPRIARRSRRPSPLPARARARANRWMSCWPARRVAPRASFRALRHERAQR